MPYRSASGRRAGQLASLLLLACVAAGLWLHRFEITRPDGHAPGPQIDTFAYFHPSAAFIHHEVGQGRLPLWNPYQMAGQPTLGLHVHAVLYPPNLLLFGLLPPRLSLPLHAVLHVFLAGLFTWLFAGRLGLGTAARLVAAFAFMLGPTLLAGLYMPPFLSSPAWLPAMLWTLHGLASDPRPRWALALGAALGLSFLGGHAQGFVYAVELAALYGVLALGFVARPADRLRVCGLAVLAGGIGFAVAAPQLFPAVELARDSVRGLDGLELKQAAFTPVTRPMIARGLLGFLAPDWVLPQARQPLLLLPLLVCGAFHRRLRAHWLFFALLLPLLGLFLTGSRSPVFRLYFELPLGDLFRLPHRMGFVYTLCGALLVAIGVDVLVRRLAAASGEALRRDAAWLLGAGVAAAVLLDVYAGTAFPFPHPALEARPLGLPVALRDFVAERAGEERVFLERAGPFDEELFDKAGTLGRLFVVPDYEPNMPGDYARFLGFSERKTWHGSVSLVGGRYRVDPQRLDLMSVRFFAAPGEAPPALRRKVRRVAGGKFRDLDGVEVTRRAEALPRIYAVRRVRTVADLDAALLALDAEDFEPRREAVLVGDAPGAPALPARADGRRDRASLVAYAPTRVTALAECAARCLVVLTDFHYPGWHALVDGEERPIERTNGIFRGLWLEPGRHEIVYSYEPGSFRTGVAVLGVAALAVAGSVAYCARGRRRGAQPVRPAP